MRAAPPLALLVVLMMAGCTGLDRLWNGEVVTDPLASDTPATGSPEPAPGHTEASTSSSSSATASRTSSTSASSSPSSSASRSTSTTQTPPPAPNGTPPTAPPAGAQSCRPEEFSGAVAAAQAFLHNLSQHRVAETVAGQVNGSYFHEDRMFDLANRTLAFSSYEPQHRFVAVGPDYAVLGPDAYRGRNDAPEGAAGLHVTEAQPGANHPLAAWKAAPPIDMEGDCLGSEAERPVMARLSSTSVVEVRIEGGRPVAASARGSDWDFSISYDHNPQAPSLDTALAPRAVSVAWNTTGNNSRVESGDVRALDGHLVLHALDAQGYTVFAFALNASHSETRDGAFLSFQDDGDGFWGPSDTVAWGGRTVSVRLLDSWAGQFAVQP